MGGSGWRRASHELSTEELSRVGDDAASTSMPGWERRRRAASFPARSAIASLASTQSSVLSGLRVAVSSSGRAPAGTSTLLNTAANSRSPDLWASICAGMAAGVRGRWSMRTGVSTTMVTLESLAEARSSDSLHLLAFVEVPILLGSEAGLKVSLYALAPSTAVHACDGTADELSKAGTSSLRVVLEQLVLLLGQRDPVPLAHGARLHHLSSGHQRPERTCPGSDPGHVLSTGSVTPA